MSKEKIEKIKEVLKEFNDWWEEKGLNDYSDVEELILETNTGNKEVERCQILLDVIEKIERICGNG